MPRSVRIRPEWDLGLTLSLLAAAIVFCPVSFLLAVFAEFSFDGCGPGECDMTLFWWAFRLAAWAPSIVVGLLVVLLVIRRRRGELGWPVAVVAVVVQAVLLFTSYLLTGVALSGATGGAPL